MVMYGKRIMVVKCQHNVKYNAQKRYEARIMDVQYQHNAKYRYKAPMS